MKVIFAYVMSQNIIAAGFFVSFTCFSKYHTFTFVFLVEKEEESMGSGVCLNQTLLALNTFLNLKEKHVLHEYTIATMFSALFGTHASNF